MGDEAKETVERRARNKSIINPQEISNINLLNYDISRIIACKSAAWILRNRIVCVKVLRVFLESIYRFNT